MLFPHSVVTDVARKREVRGALIVDSSNGPTVVEQCAAPAGRWIIVVYHSLLVVTAGEPLMGSLVGAVRAPALIPFALTLAPFLVWTAWGVLTGNLRPSAGQGTFTA